MSLCNLPVEIFRVILEDMVVTVGFFHAARLRLVCKLFNREIFNAICSSSLFEDDPRGALVSPECGLAQEYLFRLTVNAEKNAKKLPTVISQVVTYLLEKISIEKKLSGIQESYTRTLCGAAVAYLYTESPEYLRYPPRRNNSQFFLNIFAFHRTDIFSAVALLGVDDVFEYLCREGFGSTESSVYFGNPLILAASHNHYKITKSLLYGGDFEESIKGDLRPTMDRRCQALKAAARAGNADIVQLILENESVYKATKEVCHEALIEAIKGGHGRLAYSLGSHGSIKMGASIQARILEVAASHGHEDIVRETLDYRADVLSIECKNTALSRAAAKGHSDIARLLISHGANPNELGGKYLPLVDAAAGGYRVTAEILLDGGADINGGKWRPVNAAAFHGQVQMLHVLARAGADIGHLRHTSANILPQIALRGHERIMKFLLVHGVDVRSTGTGAILNAIREGHFGIVKLLTSYGAQEPQYRDLVENLHKSARDGYERWVLNLIAYGLDVDSPHPVENCTPLYWANREGHSLLRKKLVELGAKPVILKEGPQAVRLVDRSPPSIF